jgi:Flp pilus assembly protein TadB
MTGLIFGIGILVMILVVVLTMEYVPVMRKGKAARILEASTTQNEDPVSGLRRTLYPLEKPVQKWAGPGLLKKARFDLYWAQMVDKWAGWTALQFVTLRVFTGMVGAVIGLVVFKNPVFAVVVGFIGWQYPTMGVGGIARRARRQFQAQLPEYIQLVAAQMSAGISLEEALRRTSRADSLPAQWMRRVIQMAQGRTLVGQIAKEAEESQLSELISMGVQLGFIQRGTAQQQLLGQLAAQIAADYIGQAEMRAEKIGGELVIPMVIFYFLPFLVCLMALIAWPMVSGMM